VENVDLSGDEIGAADPGEGRPSESGMDLVPCEVAYDLPCDLRMHG